MSRAVRESRQGVPGRVHGCGQVHARPRARKAPRLAIRRRRRAHRTTRARSGGLHLRAPRRAVLPRGGARRAGRAAGAAASRGRDRRRHVRGSAEPRGDQRGRRVGVARRAARAVDRADSARRPPAAGRRSRRLRTPVSSAARGVRAGPRPAGRRAGRRGCARGRTARLAGTLMRYLVLTDIHANLEALDACVADARARTFDRTLVLGDLVGYGGDPNAVVERVQALQPTAIVRGNHDKVACGLEQADGFNAVAKSAARWTLDVLTPAHRDWLCALPEGPTVVDDMVEICHGAPFDEDAYIFDELDAVRALKVSTRPLCLFGHTHYPVTFELSAESFDTVASTNAAQLQIYLKPGSKYL